MFLPVMEIWKLWLVDDDYHLFDPDGGYSWDRNAVIIAINAIKQPIHQPFGHHFNKHHPSHRGLPDDEHLVGMVLLLIFFILIPIFHGRIQELMETAPVFLPWHTCRACGNVRRCA